MLSEGVSISSTSSPQEIRHKDSGSKNNQIFFIENCLEIVINIFDGCKFTKKINTLALVPWKPLANKDRPRQFAKQTYSLHSHQHRLETGMGAFGKST